MWTQPCKPKLGRLFHKYGGAGASPVDCVSFAIMNRFSIRRAFTFDSHFASAGFEILK
jgi:predicted nucleic acid-binding protein